MVKGMRAVVSLVILLLFITTVALHFKGGGIEDLEEGPLGPTRFAGGSGTKGDPYQIMNVVQLQDIREDPSAHYILMDDIHADSTESWNGGSGFEPICFEGGEFTGTLEGNGRTIRSLHINRGVTSFGVGLINRLATSGLVIRLTVSNSVIKGGSGNTGTFAASNFGVIRDCISESQVKGGEDIGGIAGFNDGTIYNCSFRGNLDGDLDIGGITGENSGSIEYCRSRVDIDQRNSDPGGSDMGGIVGTTTGVIRYCQSAGNILAKLYGVGGLAGKMSEGKIEYSFSSVNVTGKGNTGGLIGSMGGYGSRTVTNCHSSGSVGYPSGMTSPGNSFGGLIGGGSYSRISRSHSISAVNGAYMVGGLIGRASYSLDLIDCYSRGDVKGYEEVGGLAGNMVDTAEIVRCFSTGKVNGNSDIGGLVGYNPRGTVEDSFWDKDTSGRTNSDGGTGLSTSKMKTSGTFTDAGWDLDSIWNLTVGLTYPYFRYLYHTPVIEISKNKALEDEHFICDYQLDICDYPPCNDLKKIEIEEDALWLDWKILDDRLEGTPENRDVGIYRMNITISDVIGGTLSLIHTIEVINVNDPPFILTYPGTDCFEDLVYVQKFIGEDIDPTEDILQWSLDTDSDWLTIDRFNGTISGIPSNEDVGEVWVNVGLDDGLGGHDSVNYTLSVINVNDDPELDHIPPLNVFEDIPFHYLPGAEDTDPTNDVMRWKIDSADTDLISVDHVTGNISGDPEEKDVGQWWFVINVTDQRGGWDTQNVTLEVKQVNDPPSVLIDSPQFTMDEDSIHFLDPETIISDTDSNQIDYDLITGESNCSIKSKEGGFTLEPANNWNGIIELLLRADDGEYRVESKITVIVEGVNDPPEDAMISFLNETGAPDGIVLEGSAYDPDTEYGDELIYDWFSDMDGHFDSGDIVTLDITPGVHVITLKVTDSEGLETETSIELQVIRTNKDDSPTISSDGNGMSWVLLLVIGIVIVLVITGISALVIYLKIRNRTTEEELRKRTERMLSGLERKHPSQGGLWKAPPSVKSRQDGYSPPWENR
jgi:hypothetical protein